MSNDKPRISNKERQELSSLVDACTPGPWRVLRDQAQREAVRGKTADADDDFDIDPVCQILADTVWGSHDDLFLMAAAREVIPRLLDEIERLEGMKLEGKTTPVTLTPAQKAATTRKRKAAGRNAAAKRKHRAAGKKAALTRMRRAAGKKAATTKKRRAAGKKAAATRKSRGR